jgi:peptidoglycan/xylan/chitin deacetylase (PgdA/CDA1 family)
MFKKLYSKVVSTICTNNMAKMSQKIYLMFHSIEDDLSNNDSIYHMSVIRFSEICKFLDLIRSSAFNNYGTSIEFVFTFDDGYKNYIDNALPILDQYSFQSIVFLIAENLNDKSGEYISSNDLRTLVRHAGVTVGMHGYSHIDLSALSDECLLKELASIKEVCNSIEFSTNYFSLPFGRANDNVILRLNEQGYTDIFTSDYGSKVSSKIGPYIYPRIDIWSNDSNNMIKQKIMLYWKLFFIIESYKSKLYRISK